HDGIRLLKNCICYIGDFSPSRQPVGDHRFEHLRCDNDWFAESQTGFHNSALDDRQLFHWAFDSQVAPGNHDRICTFDHVTYCADGELILDFSNGQSLALSLDKSTTQFLQIAFLTNKAQSHKIDTQLCAKGNITKFLLVKRRKIHLHSGKVKLSQDPDVVA